MIKNNYREPRTRNYKKRHKAITTAIDTCLESLSTKYKIDKQSLKGWIDKIKINVKAKLEKLKKKKLPKKQNLC